MSFSPDVYKINNLNFVPLISESEVHKTILDISKQINEDYKNSVPVFLITLKGAVFFAVKLLENIELDCEIEVISAKSYGSEMKSSGNVIINVADLNLENRDVIIIEDIIDTGYTMDKLLPIIHKQSPRSVAIASLLAKPEKMCVDIKINYLGFNIPSDFIIGSGLDFDEKGRNLAGIYVLQENKNSL